MDKIFLPFQYIYQNLDNKAKIKQHRGIESFHVLE